MLCHICLGKLYPDVYTMRATSQSKRRLCQKCLNVYKNHSILWGKCFLDAKAPDYK